MSKHLYIIFLFCSFITAFSQNLTFHHPIEKKVNFGFNIFLGGQFSDLNDLNTIFIREKIPQVTPTFLTIGSGMNLIYGDHYLHFKGNASLNENKDDIDNVRTNAWGFGAGITYGYKIYLGPVLAIPYAGITTDVLFVEIQDLSMSNTSINNQIQTRNISKLHNEVFSTSLGCRFLIPNDWETMFTGIDLSYQIPIKRDWFNGDFLTTNTPDLNIGGFKIGIEILFLTGNDSW